MTPLTQPLILLVLLGVAIAPVSVMAQRDQRYGVIIQIPEDMMIPVPLDEDGEPKFEDIYDNLGDYGEEGEELSVGSRSKKGEPGYGKFFFKPKKKKTVHAYQQKTSSIFNPATMDKPKETNCQAVCNAQLKQQRMLLAGTTAPADDYPWS